ncbi:MAG TPA: allantoicase [Thermoanaerobaculia bacterium]|jgi:allantoicase
MTTVLDPSAFSDLIDLASERVGGTALAANDEFFAPKENLLKTSRPVFREDEYTDRGKWMDGWETRRRREPGHDWCVVRLGLPGEIRGVVVDTRHFVGNAPEACAIEACEAAGDPRAAALEGTVWFEILPKILLAPDFENAFPALAGRRATHVRLHIFPDGGVARLRLFGAAIPDWERLGRQGEIDLAAAENGGLVVAASDMHFGNRHNLVFPGPPRSMRDGWETRRRRGPGHDWAIVRLGAEGVVRRIVLDTSYFKGNAPGEASIEGIRAPETSVDDLALASAPWREILPRTALRPDAVRELRGEVRDVGAVTHVRLNIFPDGGVARLRLFGEPARRPSG